jgi:hypothetical protein
MTTPRSLLTRPFLAKLESTSGTDNPADGAEWGLYAESTADADGRVTLRLQWPKQAKPEPEPPNPHLAELEAVWPAKWEHRPIAICGLRCELRGVSLMAYHRPWDDRWSWEFCAEEDAEDGYLHRRVGKESTAAEAVAALKSALREYASRLLELAE